MTEVEAAPSELIRPDNWGVVHRNVYRSGYPQPRHFPFLRKLGLKTIVYIGIEGYESENAEFCRRHGINVLRVPVRTSKDEIPIKVVLSAVHAIESSRQHPVLVHCNKGKHRTGVVVGCYMHMKEIRGDLVLLEYLRYARQKFRRSDLKYIVNFSKEVDRLGFTSMEPPSLSGCESNLPVHEEVAYEDECEM